MYKHLHKIGLCSLLLISFFQPLAAEEAPDNTYTINFHDVPVVEFIQFVSRISDANFIFNHKDLQFNITLASGKPVTADHVVKALVQVLRAHGFSIAREDGYLVIHKGVMEELAGQENAPLRTYEKFAEPGAGVPFEHPVEEPIAAALPPAAPLQSKPKFLVYKLQYHAGDEIEETVRRIAGDLASKPETSPQYLGVLKSVQWIKATNSLVCSGDEESLAAVKQLIQSLDTELKQVFIEVLVVETAANKNLDFGLQWAAGAKYKNSLGMGMGNFPSATTPNPFALSFQQVNGNNPPSGPGQIPMGSGFDMGVIGDIILHKGRSFVSLASLVSALQADGDSSIVLNQKIITQDNKNSKIFVGDNIPFTGSIVTTVGTGQQSTANVEYRDIGVNLSITPRLGEGDVITLDLTEEITEALPTGNSVSNSQVTGIQTTKTNMMTHVHVPDKHFLVLSGMARNARRHHKAGLPCLGGLPVIGALFSKTSDENAKRNVIIFVRPHIIRSMDDYRQLTQQQNDFYREISPPGVFDQAMEPFNPKN
ncbi:MAG: type II secretion system protein GspD [Verrucomicrobia bacterium]|nr:type II secretion system protein GspD [Verrucomicrobiota bacterium]